MSCVAPAEGQWTEKSGDCDDDNEHEQCQRGNAEERGVEATEARAAGRRVAGQRERAGEQHDDRQRR